MPFDRRAFLRLSAIASLMPSALFATERRLLQMNGYPLNAETPLDLLTDYLTPVDLFFVRSHWIPHYPDAKTWRLTIDCEFARPRTLAISDLKKFPRVESTCLLQCAGNGRGMQDPPIPRVQWR